MLGSWSTLGSGTSLRTNVLAMHDDTLYAGGDFTSAGGVTGTSYIAAWSTRTNTWHALGNGMVGNSVWALATDDDTLYAGGTFTSASGVADTSKVAAWSDTDDTWVALSGTNPNLTVHSLAVRADDTLAVGGEFTSPTTRLALLPARSGSWVGYPGSAINDRIEAIAVQGSATPSPADDTMYIGGPFTTPGNNVAALTPDGGAWASLGAGLNGEVRALALQGQATPSLADDTLYAGGLFTDAGGADGDGIAAWNGSAWTTLSPGLVDGGSALAVWALAIDDTRGLVYAGGRFTTTQAGAVNSLRRVAVWDTGISAWIPLQFGASAADNGVTTGEVEALAVDDSVLYVGGNLDQSVSGAAGAHLRRWTWNPPTGSVDDTALPGTIVTIQGSGLIGVTSVSFGSARTGDDTPATFVRDDSTTIRVTVPAGDFNDDTIYVDAVGGVGQVGPFTSWPTWPDAPQSPAAEPGIQSATVEWTPPASDGGASVTSYVATASPGGATCASAATSCTVGGLTSGSTYTFRVRALNAKGESDLSTASNAVTPLAPVPPAPEAPEAPAQVSAVAGDRTAEVTWTAPASAGTFPITYYQVQSSPEGGSCLSADASCAVSGLTNGTAYTFRVRALNGAGWGDWSEASAPVTPRAPTILITGTRAGRVVTVTGTVTGIAAGSALAPWVRLGDGSAQRGRVDASVGTDGEFTWQRRAKRAVQVYFTHGATKSNTVAISAR